MFKNWKQQDSSKKRDYGQYEWTLFEVCLEGVKILGIAALFAYFFYDSVFAFPLMCIPGFWYLRKRKKEKIRNRKRELVRQFKECMLSVSASLQAGYAVENAFLESTQDMQMLFGKQSLIVWELQIIRQGLILHTSLEILIDDFGKRSHADEIKEFAEVFLIAKRGGGNVNEVIVQCAQLIHQKVESDEAIQTMLSSRKFEQNIMNVMPFIILFYLESTNKGYFDDLYHSVTGVAIMSVCLMVYCSAYLLSSKILNQI
ncbi:MAG: hypothetical protein LBM69_05805 [Lachnospiraceae bacterium]|jgi:tight adherence protein B|nr:hypothetical protein [Lachnospiraceae bacterium]